MKLIRRLIARLSHKRKPADSSIYPMF